MAENRDVYPIQINGVKRDLRLFEIKPGLKIAIINILGDTELVEACAQELSKKMNSSKFDVLVTAEAKSIPLAHALSVITGKPYIVLRKSYKIYMGNAIQAETVSITTGKSQTLLLDEKDIPILNGKRAAILDDVISTGSTLKGMLEIINKAGAQVTLKAAIFTEGDESEYSDVIALGHLPIFTD